MSTTAVDSPVNATVAPANATQYTYLPKVDIYEDAEALHLEAEMPGVSEQQVDVKVEEGLLTILGRVTPPTYGDYKRVFAEYESGNFERTFRIGEDIDPERIQAVLKHGVLHLTLAKREAAKPRRIDVKVLN